jgi:hypothetical protein
MYGGRDIAYNVWGVQINSKVVTICDANIHLLNNVDG